MVKKIIAAILIAAAAVTTALFPLNTAAAEDKEPADYTVRHHIVSPDGSYSHIFLKTVHTAPVGEKTSAEPLPVPGCTVRAFAQKYTMSDRTVQIDIYYDAQDGLKTGDVNADGVIDLLDAALLDRHLAGWDGYGFGSVNFYYADTNGDQKLDAADALNIRRLLVAEDVLDAENDDPWSPWV